MNRQHLITILISSCLFMFLTILFYTLYCYAFYDKNQINKFVDKINNKEFQFIYEHFQDSDKISEKDFYSVINNTLDKETITNIYNEYYKNSISEEEFMNKYYYGDVELTRDNVEIKSSGKTTYGTRKKLSYKSINLKKDNNEVNISVLNNINFITNVKTTINIDNTLDMECNGRCTINDLLGGIHIINIKQYNKEYISVINISNSNTEIDLINHPETIIIKEDHNDDGEAKEFSNVHVGTYYVSECYIEQSVLCATPSKSYLELNEDNTVYLHLYSSWEVAGTDYWGTYRVENNFLILEISL